MDCRSQILDIVQVKNVLYVTQIFGYDAIGLNETLL